MAFSSPLATSPQPNCSKGQLPFKQGGYLIVGNNSMATAIPGVYAAGDVTDDIYRQAVTAAGMGCIAALEVEKYLHASEQVRKAAE
jgi:thioredoxin reductase (NADPH)